jgi:hypothetical protein
MIPENTHPKKYWYRPYEGYETRCQRRLQKDLGVDETAAETILYLRNQVIELQDRVRQMQVELNAQIDNENLRLARYREIYYEATWIELEFKEG